MTEDELIAFLIEYEIRASWWTGYVSSDGLQGLAARYFARKTKRKLKRYLWAKTTRKRLAEVWREEQAQPLPPPPAEPGTT